MKPTKMTHCFRAGPTFNSVLAPFLLVLTLFAILPADSPAAIYYVDQNHPSCRDTNAGTSETAPWCTLHRATDGVPSREQGGIAGTFQPVGAGDTVYVKNGTYIDISVSVTLVGFFPVNSGAAVAPIAFRAYTPPTGPRHKPILKRTVTAANETYQIAGSSGGYNYIIWDGFTLSTRNTMKVQPCTGCIVENMTIDPGPFEWPGLYQGIFIQNTTNVIVRNNIIRNVYYSNQPADANASCTKHYYNTGLIIRNNDFSNCNAGIYDKGGGVSNTFELNYLHDMHDNGAAVTFDNFAAYAKENMVVRNNIIVGGGGIGMNMVRDARNIQFYNNTMYNVQVGVGFEGMTTLSPSYFIYNNVIVRKDGTGNYDEHLYFNDYSHPDPDVPVDLLSNYNSFYGIFGPQARFSPVFGTFESLSQWRARGFDLNSLTLDPLFVGPLSGTLSPAAFQLQSTSPLRNAGRVGGVSTGAPVNIGAYATGSEIIGPMLGSSGDAATAPTAPTNLVVR